MEHECIEQIYCVLMQPDTIEGSLARTEETTVSFFMLLLDLDIVASTVS